MFAVRCFDLGKRSPDISLQCLSGCRQGNAIFASDEQPSAIAFFNCTYPLANCASGHAKFDSGVLHHASPRDNMKGVKILNANDHKLL
jgi:hypothetical protein